MPSEVKGLFAGCASKALQRLIAALAAACAPCAMAQLCGPVASLPYRTLVRPIGHENTAADLSIAAGLSRIVEASNSGVRIHCKNGYAMTAQASLSGTNVSTDLFVNTDTNFEHYQTFDPRVIYDGEDGRFWMVASEADFDADPDQGRIHIAVSGAGMTDGEVPQSWSTTYWIKYTGDQPSGASGPSIDPESFSGDHFASGHIPDRPTIAVDRDFLYIWVREGTLFQSAALDRMLMIVMCKADLIAGTPTVVESRFIDTDAEIGSVMHALAVDSTIPESGVHRVYMVTLPNIIDRGDVGGGHNLSSIRVGAFTGTGTCGGCESELTWDYDFVDVELDEGDDYVTIDFLAPEAKGAASGTTTGINAQVPGSLFMNAMTRVIGGDRRIWCVHNVLRPEISGNPPPPITQLQWYQINLHGWSDSGSPDFDRVERIALDDPYDDPLSVFDGAIAANECEDVAIGFTRGASYNPISETWTYPQFWKALYPNGAGPTIAVVAAGASQYYDPASGSTVWADFAGASPDPDPEHPSRFFGLHMTGHDDNAETGGDSGQRTKNWEAWLASWSFGSCDSSFLSADLDEDSDIDADDVALFREYVNQQNMAADLDRSQAIDAMDLLIMLNAVGEEP